MRLLLVLLELLVVILAGIGLYSLISSLVRPNQQSKSKRELPENIDRLDE